MVQDLAPMVSCVVGSGSTPYSHCGFEVMLSFEVRYMGQASKLWSVQLPAAFNWSRFERERGEGAFVAAV